MERLGWAILVACVVLFPAALTPVLGWAGLAASGLLALVLTIGLGRKSRGAGWWAWLTRGLILLGSIVGAAGVMAAFLITTANEYSGAYGARAALGWLALACTAAAAGAALLAIRRPYLAGSILVLSGVIGGIAINLFYVNTAYGAAVFLWWLAALSLFVVS